MKGLGKGGVNAPPQMLRRCCWLRACEEIPWNGLIETGFTAVLRLTIGDFAKKSQTLSMTYSDQ